MIFGKLAHDCLQGSMIMRNLYGFELIRDDAGPNDMAMLAVFLFVEDDRAGLAGKA